MATKSRKGFTETDASHKRWIGGRNQSTYNPKEVKRDKAREDPQWPMYEATERLK